MDSFNDFLSPKLPEVQDEARQASLDAKIIAFVDSLPPIFKEFILAQIEADETGTMPMPPMPPMPIDSPIL